MGVSTVLGRLSQRHLVLGVLTIKQLSLYVGVRGCARACGLHVGPARLERSERAQKSLFTPTVLIFIARQHTDARY